MKRFALLVEELERTTYRDEKIAATIAYFRETADADAAWAVYLLHGGRPARLAAARQVAAWAMEVADVPSWLFDACYDTVGDLAETISLIVPEPTRAVERPLHAWVEQRLLPLAQADARALRHGVEEVWHELGGTQRLVWNKLVTGSFRAPVTRPQLVEALAQCRNVDAALLAQRLAERWRPSAATYRALTADSPCGDASRRYPLVEPPALDRPVESLGDPSQWTAQWQREGVRAQLLRRDGEPQLWSAAGEPIGAQFRDLLTAAVFLPTGTVLDGTVLAPRGQPAAFLAYDVLEDGGADVRGEAWSWRRDRLTRLVQGARAAALRLAPTIPLDSWDDAGRAHAEARAHGRGGILLRRHDSAGTAPLAAYVWDAAPFTAKAVLLYAQPARGRRGAVQSEFTLGVWHDGALIPFARVRSGLSDSELRSLDSWIRRHTVAKFGPVRHVPPRHVFELGFDTLQRSLKHKSGVAVRGARILRWAVDLAPEAADTLDGVRALLLRPE